LGSSSGSTAQFTFSSPGTYYYYCTIHLYAGMHGAVVVAAASTPPPSSRSSPTAKPTGVLGSGTTTPGTGAGVGGPMLLLPLGFLLILAGVAGRRKR
jgi:FtsP/CotA-like multicopper oxidase with cupredoxin domain